MENSDSLPRAFSQNERLPIRLVAPGFGHASPEIAAVHGMKHRLAYYFFLFVWEGTAEFGADLEKVTVEQHELAFARPHQIRQTTATDHSNLYYKLGLPQVCLAQLPRYYPCLLNPLNQLKIRFTPAAAARLNTLFELLKGLLSTPDTPPELILAHLHGLLTEINLAYFAAVEKPAAERLAKYIAFSVFVEDNLTEHPSIERIAQVLAVSTDSLYQLVKHYTGLSPKAFITNRLMLEARRRLYYREQSSVKELAFELGYNDPAYFSRLFKKVTGRTVASFLQDLS